MPIAQLRPAGLITGENIPPHEVPQEYWTFAKNMLFRDVYARRQNGWRATYDSNPLIGATDPPLYIQNNIHAGINFWMYGTDAELGVTDAAGTHTDLTPVAGAPSGAGATDYTGCELNGFPIINWRDAAGPHSWDRNVGSNFAPLTDWPSGYICNVVRTHRFYIMAFNISGAVDWPSVVLWSDSAAPGNLPSGTAWTPGAANDAGSLSLGSTGEGITDALTLRDQMVIYKTNSSYLLQYVGGQLVFGQREFLRTAGALANNCAAEWLGLHFLFSDGDLLMHDGNQARSIADRATKRTIFSEIDQDNYLNSYVVTNNSESEIYFCYPEAGSTHATKALVFDARSQRARFKDTVDIFGQGSFQDIRLGGSGTPHMAYGNVSTNLTLDKWNTIATTWTSETNNWNSQDVPEAIDGLVAIEADTPVLVRMDIGVTPDSGSINAKLRRESLDFGDANRKKLCREVRPRIKGGNNINVRVGVQDLPQEQIKWSASKVYNSAGTPVIPFVGPAGRYLSFEFSSSGGQPWEITGFDVQIEWLGRY